MNCELTIYIMAVLWSILATVAMLGAFVIGRWTKREQTSNATTGSGAAACEQTAEVADVLRALQANNGLLTDRERRLAVAAYHAGRVEIEQRDSKEKSTMHKNALRAIYRSVKKRVAQGDCPTEPPIPREQLEEAILELVRMQPPLETHKLPDDLEIEQPEGQP